MNEPLFGTVSGTMMPSQGFGLFPGSPPFCDPSLVFGFFASGGFFFYTRGFRAVKNGPHPGLIILDFSGEGAKSPTNARNSGIGIIDTPGTVQLKDI